MRFKSKVEDLAPIKSRSAVKVAKKQTTPDQVVKQIDSLRNKLKIYHKPHLAIQEWFSTGLFLLDIMINRGLPGGRIVELSGPTGCGKSTLAATIIRQAQLAGGRGDYFDLEAGATQGMIVDMAKVEIDNPESWDLWRPENAEQAFTIIDRLIPIVGDSGRLSVIVIDSVPAIVPENEHKTNYGDTAQLAGVARLLTQFIRKNTVKLDRYPNVLILLINHVTEAFKPANPFGPTEYVTPGGRSTRYYPSVRIRFDKGYGGDKPESDKVKDKNVILRTRMKLVLWKNRVGSSQRTALIPLNFMNESMTASVTGFDDARSVIEFLLEEGVLVPSKAESGKPNGYYHLNGFEGDKKREATWIRLYNKDPEVKKMLQDATTVAAAVKWAPCEDGSAFEDGYEIPDDEDD